MASFTVSAERKLSKLTVADTTTLPRLDIATAPPKPAGSMIYSYPDSKVYVSDGKDYNLVTGSSGGNVDMPALGVPGALGTDSSTGKLVLANAITGRFDFVDHRPQFKILFYYGTPSTLTILPRGNPPRVAGTPLPTLDAVAQAFAEYDYVVLGDGLEHPTHPDYTNTVAIVQKLHALAPSTIVWGYIDLGVATQDLSIETMQSYVQQWQTVGADGVFWDDAGYDFQTPRSRQSTMVLYARGLSPSMPSFMNSFNPDDIFSSAVDPTYNPTGAPTVLGPNDWFLLEDFPYGEDAGGWKTAMDPSPVGLIPLATVAQNYRSLYGTKIAAIAPITLATRTFSELQYFRSMCQSIGFVFSLDAYGDAPVNFSSGPIDVDTVFKGWFDMEMARYGMNGPQPFSQTDPTTINRHDYETIVTYIDGTQYAYETPLTNAPVFSQYSPILATNGVATPGFTGRLGLGAGGTYVRDSGTVWVPVP